MKRKRLAVLLSGGGTTAAAVFRACDHGELRDLYEPVCVIASNHHAGGVDRAHEAGISRVAIIPPPLRPKFPPIEDAAGLTARQQYAEARSAFGLDILEVLRQAGTEVVAQLGWLPRTPVNVIEAFPGAMINQHPGPLDPGHPDFGGPGMFGRRVHAARLAFVREVKREDNFFTEATVQFVHPEFDRGSLIVTQTLEIQPEDDVPSLQQRLLPIEHATVIKALIMLAHGEAQPLSRRERLVLPREVDILQRIKRQAIRDWPQG